MGSSAPGGKLRALLRFLANRHIRGASAYFLVQVFQSGVSLVLIPLYTRYLPPREYGIVATCAAFAAAVNFVIYLCIHESAYFVLIQRRPDAPARIATILAFEVMVATVMAPLVLLATWHWRDTTLAGVPLFPYVGFIACTSMAGSIVTTYLLTLQAQEKITRCALFSFAYFMAITGLQVYFLVGPKLAALSYVYAQTIVSTIAALLAIAALARSYGFGLSRVELRGALGFSVPLVPHNAAQWARSNADRVILSTLTSTAETGIYGLAATYASVLSMASEAFRLVYNPRFFALVEDPERNAERIAAMLPASLAGLSALAIAMSLLAKEIFRWFLAPAYWNGFHVVPLVCVSLLIFAVYINVVNVLFQRNRTVLIGIATIVGSIVGLATSWVLVARFGMWGSALGLVAMNACTTTLVIFFAQRQLRLPWPFAPTLISIALPLGAYLGGALERWPLWLRLVAVVVAAGLLAVINSRSLRRVIQPSPSS
jgi:O-antigen/teichoic acid export membrane protein